MVFFLIANIFRHLCLDIWGRLVLVFASICVLAIGMEIWEREKSFCLFLQQIKVLATNEDHWEKCTFHRDKQYICLNFYSYLYYYQFSRLFLQQINALATNQLGDMYFLERQPAYLPINFSYLFLHQIKPLLKRFPEGDALGKSEGQREWTSQYHPRFTGMDQEIHACVQGRIGIV